jgi:hypothetical protein
LHILLVNFLSIDFNFLIGKIYLQILQNKFYYYYIFTHLNEFHAMPNFERAPVCRKNLEDKELLSEAHSSEAESEAKFQEDMPELGCRLVCIEARIEDEFH